MSGPAASGRIFAFARAAALAFATAGCSTIQMRGGDIHIFTPMPLIWITPVTVEASHGDPPFTRDNPGPAPRPQP